MKKKEGVTHEEVQQALYRFRERGGVITRLPDELVGQPNTVKANSQKYEFAAEKVKTWPNGR